MARPREFDEEQVIESLMSVFWEKGYEAASMQDLMAATGLLKGSLYGAFGDKQSMYLAALRHYDRTRIQAGIGLLRGEASAADKVSRLFDGVIESLQAGIFAGGCLLCNAGIEMAAVDASVKREVDRTIRRLHDAVLAALEADEAARPGNIALAALIVSAYFGCRVLAKAGASVDMIRDTRDRCVQLLH